MDPVVINVTVPGQMLYTPFGWVQSAPVNQQLTIQPTELAKLKAALDQTS